MPFVLHFHDRTLPVRIVARRPLLRLEVGGKGYTVDDLAGGTKCEFEIMLDGRRVRGWRYVTADEAHIRFGDRTYLMQFPQQATGFLDDDSGNNELRAEMPGTVVAIHCRDGDSVKAGDKLITTESMKLQVVHVSPCDGTVESIDCRVDWPFDKGALLLTLTKVGECP